METWKVDEIHLERVSSDGQIESHTVPCRSVDFTPTASPSEGIEEGGSLNVSCAQAPAALPWEPSRVRFKAARYIEERLFEVGGHRIEGDHLVLLLASPPTHIDINASDSHIGQFHSSNDRT